MRLVGTLKITGILRKRNVLAADVSILTFVLYIVRAGLVGFTFVVCEIFQKHDVNTNVVGASREFESCLNVGERAWGDVELGFGIGMNEKRKIAKTILSKSILDPSRHLRLSRRIDVEVTEIKKKKHNKIQSRRSSVSGHNAGAVRPGARPYILVRLSFVNGGGSRESGDEGLVVIINGRLAGRRTGDEEFSLSCAYMHASGVGKKPILLRLFFISPTL